MGVPITLEVLLLGVSKICPGGVARPRVIPGPHMNQQQLSYNTMSGTRKQAVSEQLLGVVARELTSGERGLQADENNISGLVVPGVS